MLAALIFAQPARASEQSLETGVTLQKYLDKETPSWDEIISQQLKRRETQIEAARIAEEAQKAEQAKAAQKARETARETRRTQRYAASSYSFGNCTYYVASKRGVPPGWGNAREWRAHALQAGWEVSARPIVGAIAWTAAGRLGHVAYVQAISGSTVTVSEMNYAGFNVVSTRSVSVSEFLYLY